MQDKTIEHITIDGKSVELERGLNVLEHARKVGIEIPSFCYSPELSIYGACRMCLVEIVDQKTGRVSLDSSCSLLPKANMEIRTSTEKLRTYRKSILELLIANHCQECTSCSASHSCKLKEYARNYGIREIRYSQLAEENKDINPACIQKDNTKCVLCGLCIRTCNEIQKVGAIDFAHRGSEMSVSCTLEKPIKESSCVACGQCTTACPTGALSVRTDVKSVWKLLGDKSKKLSVQIDPAVYTTIDSAFGLESDENSFGRLATALRMIGFAEVYDTGTAIDMAIIQSAEQLLKSFNTKRDFPLFTSTCHSWIMYAEKMLPEIFTYISSVKSPMQIYGGVHRKEGVQNFIHGAIVSCSSKKVEIMREEFKGDTSFVLTTQEIVQMIKEVGVRYSEIKSESGTKWGKRSGASIISAVSGGFTEAVLRHLLFLLKENKAENYRIIAESGIRGLPSPDPKSGLLTNGIKTAKFKFGERELSVAVVSGLANADKIIERIKEGEHFDFVEVMSCPGGCICGAGQMKSKWATKEKRSENLYLADSKSDLKSAEENPVMSEWQSLMGSKQAEEEHWHSFRFFSC
jgi:NADH-quinone oxidoreductase subunit G